MAGPYEKVVLVTKATALEELTRRYNQRAQARFYLEHMNVSFTEYEAADAAYHAALASVQRALTNDLKGVRQQIIERAFLPTFQFGPHDVVVTLGPDGLVVNTAKYLHGQPLVALNPDAQRIDGVLVPFPFEQVGPTLRRVLDGDFTAKPISMARATLSDGQSLLAVNDLFIGQRTHVSARYRLTWGELEENQSSSGIIVSTGAGSTGWYRSLLTGAAGIVHAVAPKIKTDKAADNYRFDPAADELRFCVREPFVSRTSSADVVAGSLGLGESLVILSQMPQGGVIFSDGIEADFLEFGSGLTATVALAEEKVNLVVPRDWGHDR